jgi:hypothetical protein
VHEFISDVKLLMVVQGDIHCFALTGRGEWEFGNGKLKIEKAERPKVGKSGRPKVIRL